MRFCDCPDSIPFQGRPGERGPKGQPGDQGTPVSIRLALSLYVTTDNFMIFFMNACYLILLLANNNIILQIFVGRPWYLWTTRTAWTAWTKSKSLTSVIHQEIEIAE